MTQCRRSSSSTFAPLQVALQSNERPLHPAQCLPSRTTVTTATATAHVSSVCSAQVAATPARISTERISLSRSHQESGCACCRFLVIPLLTCTHRMYSYAPHMIGSVIVWEATDVRAQHGHPTCQLHHRLLWKEVQVEIEFRLAALIRQEKGSHDMLHQRPTRTVDPLTPLILRHSACRRISPLPSISIHRFSSRHSQIQA